MPERAMMRPDDLGGSVRRGRPRGGCGTARSSGLGASSRRAARAAWTRSGRSSRPCATSASPRAWVGGGPRRPTPWHPLDLPWDEAPAGRGRPVGPRSAASLDEVLALRGERRARSAVLDADRRAAACAGRPARRACRAEGLPSTSASRSSSTRSGSTGSTPNETLPRWLRAESDVLAGGVILDAAGVPVAATTGATVRPEQEQHQQDSQCDPPVHAATVVDDLGRRELPGRHDLSGQLADLDVVLLGHPAGAPRTRGRAPGRRLT